MKKPFLTAVYKSSKVMGAIACLFGLVFIFTAFSTVASAQANQLMLADIVIALRSKKVTLSERNKILADAVLVRGVTFSLTPEIEKELEDTGADKTLIESIKQKSRIVKAVAVVSPPVETKPKVEPVAPPPPDFSFYLKRADASLSNGALDAAVTDFTKALEMNPEASTALLGRGIAYSGKRSYDLAIGDLNKFLERAPTNSSAYNYRGEAYERSGDKDSALADYKKAAELDPANASAKTGAVRLEEAIAAAKPKPEPVITQPVAMVVPEVIDLGAISKESAIHMIVPVYPAMAAKLRVGGKVVVDVTLDTEGKVTSAKASSGNQFLRQACEDAAKRSQFKPAMFGSQAVKAKGFLVYNFTSPQ